VRYKVPFGILSRTFDQFRRCGDGQRECQALWISSWQNPREISQVIHPVHTAQPQGYMLDSLWLNTFWSRLCEANEGIRVQVHTHPQEAFHSPSDDAFPIIHTPGFLSLVIPNFAMGHIGLKDAFLTEIMDDGGWREVRCEDHLEIT
jgi:hypothetical protein